MSIYNVNLIDDRHLDQNITRFVHSTAFNGVSLLPLIRIFDPALYIIQFHVRENEIILKIRDSIPQMQLIIYVAVYTT
jgi:hypothetical protein